MGKLIGGVLLIVGTSIGAGILALPVSVAQAGFVSSSILLFLCWLLMTFAAFLILEVNLWFPNTSNIITMAKETLGIPGQIVAWIVYLALLYSLLTLYMSGGTDVLHSLMGFAGVHTSDWYDSLVFTVVLGSVVYCGTKTIDYVNRGLMFIKLGSFILLLALVLMHVHPAYVLSGNASKLWPTVMVMITSFGLATLVPSLRVYFHSDVKKLRRVILIGSLIPLTCYILWDLAILGTVPLEGSKGLLFILQSGHTVGGLMTALQDIVNSETISEMSKLFTSICVATSFLGVSLCMTDFLADGLNIDKRGWGNLKIITLTYLPPVVIVLFYPTVFMKALNYAGTFTTTLLALLPALMVWRGRYVLKLSGAYRVFGGKPLILLGVLVSFIAVVVGVVQEFHIVN